MMNLQRPANQVEKPVVCLQVAGSIADEVLHFIGWGLEEEGIPFQISYEDHESASVALAKKAACRSRLHVGIGVSLSDSRAVLHHRDLPAPEPLSIVALQPVFPESLMRLGKNAARLVKGNPLNLGDCTESAGQAYSTSAIYPDNLQRMVSQVVFELAKYFQER